jgi:hypothetical protein
MFILFEINLTRLIVDFSEFRMENHELLLLELEGF